MFQSKRLIAVLIGSLGFLSVEKGAFAREYSSIVLGPTFSQNSFLNSNIAGPSSIGVGLSFGSFFGLEISDRFGFESGFLFVKRTTSFNNGVQYSGTTLNIPLLVTYVPVAHHPHLKLELGPYLGLMPSGSLTQNGSNLSTIANIDDIDIGAVGGLTYLISLSSKADLRMSALYYFGFTDMSSRSGVVKSRGLDTLIGLSFYI